VEILHAFDWAPLVADRSRLAHEATARGDGYPQYGILDIKGDGVVVPRARQSQYAPVF
jgi:hypothetical protein